MKIARYGFRPSLPDHRNIPYQASQDGPLPEAIDLRVTGFFPEVWDQLAIGSCTSHGVLAAFEYEQRRQKLPPFNASRLAHYYMERTLEGSPLEDTGAEIRDGIKVVLADGVVDEKDWPYDIAKFAQRPPQELYHQALQHKAVEYQNIAVDGSSFHIRHALSNNFPVIIGIAVYESFESDDVARTGVVPMPRRSESLIGGHCMLVVGYEGRNFIVRNSWGADFGPDGGHPRIPFDYICDPNLGSDYWIIRSAS